MGTREMVSLIPRVSSFAVSGTPARSQVQDLIHVWKYVSFQHRCAVNSNRCRSFLRVPPIWNNPKLWLRLLKPGYIAEFKSLFDRYAIRYFQVGRSPANMLLILALYDRTVKASVKDELTIPKQTRYLVPIEMGRVERHVRIFYFYTCRTR